MSDLLYLPSLCRNLHIESISSPHLLSVMDVDAIKALNDDIIRSYGEPGNAPIQSEVLMGCMRMLSLEALASEIHFFCNASLQPIAGHSLVMFSFPSGQHIAMGDVVKQRMNRSLSRCPDCIRGFQRCLSQIKLRFVLVRRVSVSHLEQFLNIIIEWRITSIRRLLEGLPSDATALAMTYFEIATSPAILRKDPQLQELVNSKSDLIDLPTYISPGLIYLLVEAVSSSVTLAGKMDLNLGPLPLQLDPQAVDEFNRQSYRLQDARHFSPERSKRFWSMVSLLIDKLPASEFTKLLRPADIEEMSAHLQLRFLPLIGVLFMNILAGLDQPFPVFLVVFQKLLKLYPVSFWDIAKGYHFTQILDGILANTNYHRLLREAATNPDLPYSMDQLLGWMPTFVESLAGSQKQTAAIRITDFLVLIEKAELVVAPINSVSILTSCLNLENVTPTTSSGQLLKMRDSRLCVSKHSLHFLLLTRKDSAAQTMAMDLLCLSLQYDILVAANNSATLERKQHPTFFDTNSTLWSALLAMPLSNEFVSALLDYFEYVLFVIIFKEQKNLETSKELDAAIKIHNRETQSLCSIICSLMDKISLADPDRLLVILTKPKSLLSLWNAIFCVQTSQAALNLVSQVFDSEGRFEAISELLKNLQPNLVAINSALSNVTSMKLFEPCPRVTRIMMDVIKALTDPLNGITTTNHALAEKCRGEMKNLWFGAWSFLIMVYQTTLTWAGLYHLQDLVEFTRDTLDTSHLLLDAFRTLAELFKPEENEQETQFSVFMNAFNHVIVWLRLGDPSLLTSCLNLVFKGFDLAKDLNVVVDRSFIANFAKYGARAKKFNNKLTEQQRLEVLAKASEFDPTLVQFIIDDTARERKGTPVSSAASASQVSSSVTPGATYAYQSRKTQAKQLTLARFGVVTNEAPVAPPPPKPFTSTNMEAIRNELKNKRAPTTNAPLNPAPARPAGFNQKHTPVGRSINQLKQRKPESDSSEDDEDVDVSDLFLDSKKKSKITELDIHGRPVVKMAAGKKIDHKRLEEERMRLRLNVNLKPLYSTLLKWNYTSNSDYPSEDRSIYHPIKDKYASAKEYTSMIEPLLMLECWQGIQSSRVTGQELPFELVIGSRTTCDGFFDVYTSIKKTDLVNKKIGDTDLLVLGYTQDKGITDPHDVSKYLKSTNTQTCLAKVREIKFVNPDYSDLTLRVYPQGSMMGLLTPKSVIVAMKVMQMTTLEREYSSLKGLQYYDLCDEIVQAKPAVPVNISDARAKEICGTLNVNVSQAKAILGSQLNDGFSLIQGPPGTGKSKTILGIVGHILSQSTSSNTIEVPTSIGSKSGTPEESKGPKVLLCAPSNAAIDELVVRLKDGVFNSAGKKITPRIVRLGRTDALNSAVKEYGLEELVERQLKVRTNEISIDPTIRLQHNECIAERDRLRKELKNESLSDEEILSLETQLREVSKKRGELGKKLDEQREQTSIAHRTREIERRQAQAKILTEAQIICSTLSGSAHDFLLSMSMKFDQVIIDEACQCVELSAIIPLRYGCKKCIMVGDPNQLPPTVLSQAAASYNYEESLFVRMQRNSPNSVYLLDVQYRMHPEISKFPSAQFYHSRLTDGEGMFEKNDRPWHKEYPLTPYRFFDIVSRHQQSDQSKSFFNAQEAKVAIELVENLMKILPDNKFTGRIGVISPYKEQIRTLRDMFQRKWGRNILNEIDFNTVDGFQGQEKEIIIMSCVRASQSGSVGFLSDIRRMNVALTRARTTLWILGNKDSLKRDKIWNKLIGDAEARNCVTSVQPGFMENPTMRQRIQAAKEEKVDSQLGVLDGQRNSNAQSPDPDTISGHRSEEGQATSELQPLDNLGAKRVSEDHETTSQKKRRFAPPEMSDRSALPSNDLVKTHSTKPPKKSKKNVYIHQARAELNAEPSFAENSGFGQQEDQQRGTNNIDDQYTYKENDTHGYNAMDQPEDHHREIKQIDDQNTYKGNHTHGYNSYKDETGSDPRDQSGFVGRGTYRGRGPRGNFRGTDSKGHGTYPPRGSRGGYRGDFRGRGTYPPRGARGGYLGTDVNGRGTYPPRGARGGYRGTNFNGRGRGGRNDHDGRANNEVGSFQDGQQAPTSNNAPAADRKGYYKPSNRGKTSSVFINRPRPQNRP